MLKYIITARRSNCEIVYFVNNPTQGAKMIFNAYSLARRFDNEESADKVVEGLKEVYKGLDSWSIEQAME